jgi:DNA-binding transcriptional MerR regulator
MEIILINSDYISLNECSEITGIHISTIVSYRERGVFVPVYIVAGKKCYKRDDVLKWKRPAKNKPGPKPRNGK